jgi:hypothetical protein
LGTRESPTPDSWPPIEGLEGPTTIERSVLNQFHEMQKDEPQFDQVKLTLIKQIGNIFPGLVPPGMELTLSSCALAATGEGGPQIESNSILAKNSFLGVICFPPAKKGT